MVQLSRIKTRRSMTISGIQLSKKEEISFKGKMKLKLDKGCSGLNIMDEKFTESEGFIISLHTFASGNKEMISLKIFLPPLFLLLMTINSLFAQTHPGLLLTKEGVEEIKRDCCPSIYQKSLDRAKQNFEVVLKEKMEVPIPKDMAGGYSHETHKGNYANMKTAGILYQITDDEKYGNYVKTMLLEYVDLFSRIDRHPSMKSYSPGKLFWQCLNDANWLLNTAQAYDAVYNYLGQKDRDVIENKLLIPYADYISIESPQFFNRIHNHSTWANAAVGMIGLAIDNDELVERALYGLKGMEDSADARDNDGGYIYEEGRAKAGFLAQIDFAFSPDGYYEEGPYYHRYAMHPFMVFAQALSIGRPELKIFEYRNALLIKAVKTLLAQTNAVGEFYPINDAQKGMSIRSNSVVTAVNIAYANSQDEAFLLASQLQEKVLLDQNGLLIAKALEGFSADKVERPSVQLRDGRDGDKGALGILRSGLASDEFNAVFKYTSQGLGHGHFDKLSYSIYDGKTEVMQDYGAARWVNIEQKSGGRYLEENRTWAKQTLAHNTLVIDEESHFNGDYKKAKSGFSLPIYFNANDKNLQIISAYDTMAYQDQKIERVLALWKAPNHEKAIVIDVLRTMGQGNHSFDLPFHFAGQYLAADFDYEINLPQVLGNKAGYQHVYQEGLATLKNGSFSFNWLKDKKFYTLTAASRKGDEIIFARIGANDPSFNLRRDPFIIHRKKNTENPIFISVIESHGTYNPVSEKPNTPFGSIKEIERVIESRNYTVFNLLDGNGKSWTVCISHYEGDSKESHEVADDQGRVFSWEGPISISKTK